MISREKKRTKQVGVAIGVSIIFLLGFYFGGKKYQNDNDSYYLLDDFLNDRLLPALNETYGSLMTQYYYADTTSSGNGTTTTETTESSGLRPGQIFKSNNPNIRAKHPVILVPGFISGGLEIWSSEKCLSKMFREAIWGGTFMAKAFLHDKECWLRHVALDPHTGMDPPKSSKNSNDEGDDYIRIRPQTGFEAADYFVNGFWLFGKLIQSLADVGYLPKNMAMMGYDWRLAFPLIEERDGLLTDFKLKVERMVELNGEKAVLLGHSMGNCLILFFLRWVCEPKERGGGGGGDDWVERHVASLGNIGGPILGVPKAVSALASGEMKETAVLGKIGPLLEGYLGAKKRKDLVQTWASVWSMLPKGGPALWEVGADDVISGGGKDEAAKPPRVLEPSPNHFEDRTTSTSGSGEGNNSQNRNEEGSCSNIDDSQTSASSSESCKNSENVIMEYFKADRNFVSDEVASIIETFDAIPSQEINIDKIIQFILDWGGGLGPKVAAARYTSFRSKMGIFDNDITTQDHTEQQHPNESTTKQQLPKPTMEQWHNPVATPLPYAPSMKMYCLYGVGIETERGYYYKRHFLNTNDANNDTKLFADPPYIIDTEYNDPKLNVTNGVRTTDGDGSVPLLSLGYMCARGWIDDETLNPSNLAIVTKEFIHEAEFSMSDPMRAGPKAGEHCDILGNEEMTFDVLSIVTGEKDKLVERRIVSDVESIADRIDSHSLGGLGYVSMVESRYKPGPVVDD